MELLLPIAQSKGNHYSSQNSNKFDGHKLFTVDLCKAIEKVILPRLNELKSQITVLPFWI